MQSKSHEVTMALAVQTVVARGDKPLLLHQAQQDRGTEEGEVLGIQNEIEAEVTLLHRSRIRLHSSQS